MSAYQTYEVRFGPYSSAVFTAESEADAIERSKHYDELPPISVKCLSLMIEPKRVATGIYGIDADLCIKPEQCRASGRCLATTACTE